MRASRFSSGAARPLSSSSSPLRPACPAARRGRRRSVSSCSSGVSSDTVVFFAGVRKAGDEQVDAVGRVQAVAPADQRAQGRDLQHRVQAGEHFGRQQSACAWRCRRWASAAGSAGSRRAAIASAMRRCSAGSSRSSSSATVSLAFSALHRLRAGNIQSSSRRAPCRTGRSCGRPCDAPQEAAVACVAQSGLHGSAGRLRGRRAVARAAMRARRQMTRAASALASAGGRRSAERTIGAMHHDFSISIRSTPSRCCQCSRPSTSMPSSGVVERRQRDDRAADRPARRRRARCRPARPGRSTTPPAVFERTSPSGASFSSRASAAGIAVPVAPVSTRKSTARPLIAAGPVVVAVGAAADLDHAGVGLEARLLGPVQPPLDREEHGQPGDQPDGDELKRVRQIAVHGRTMPRIRSSVLTATMRSLFHLAYHVNDLAAARRFYGGVLGCAEGRSTETWVDFDFFGHQISLHLGTPFATSNTGRVGDHMVPMPHLGLVLELPTGARWRSASKAPASPSCCRRRCASRASRASNGRCSSATRPATRSR